MLRNEPWCELTVTLFPVHYCAMYLYVSAPPLREVRDEKHFQSPLALERDFIVHYIKKHHTAYAHKQMISTETNQKYQVLR